MKNDHGVASRDFADDENKKTNNTDDVAVSSEGEMVKKRIYNPVTRKYYKLQERSSVNRDAGQIRGLWHPPAKKAPAKKGRSKK